MGSVSVTGCRAPGSNVLSEEWVASSWFREKPMAMGSSPTSGAIVTFRVRSVGMGADLLGLREGDAQHADAVRRCRFDRDGKLRSEVLSFTASSGAAPCSTIHAVRPRMNTAEPRLAAPAKVRIAPPRVSCPSAS